MLELIEQVFNSRAFVPRGQCYTGRADILYLNVGADLLVVLLSCITAGLVLHLYRKKSDPVLKWVVVFAITSAVACGASHAIEIWTIWDPQYAIAGIAKVLWAGVSLATVVSLVPLISRPSKPVPKETHPLWTNDELEQKKQELVQILETQKLYLDSSLRLSQLAAYLGLREYQTTQLIQQAFCTTFYDLLNSLRVEHAKTILQSSAGRTKKLLFVAMESGFNSKSVFNGAFKKHTGLTPSEFRSQLHKKK